MKKSKSQKTTSAKKSAVVKEIADDLSGKPAVPEEFLIVGLGASAGGIQALKEFFGNVPADSGVAYVVILHLSPDHDSQLAGVLQTVSKIPVTQVTERVRVEPNRVYVVPPNEHLEMFDGEIEVSPNTTIEERRAPVDIFFRTLAESHHARAIAVILSGTGANGSMGIKRIKERGGAAFVQNPREAEFSEMPRNSIATDLIDAILNAGEIPARIIAYKQSLGKVEIPVEAEQRPEDTQHALREIFTQLRLRTGHDFSNYKRPTILRRIERRINVFDLPDLTAYANFLRDNRDEANALLKDLLISVTNFFRDKEAFHHLENEILPKIFYGKTGEDQVRIWVCGCATGEEAYSIAMLCSERALGVIDAPVVQIFATDIDEQAIATARDGLYTLNDAADVSPERLRRFFTKENEGYRIRRELREMILFANHNVIKDPPFSKLDAITCRNMLIYLNSTAQERVMETFHFALNPGGFLFLGNSESVDGAGDLYAAVSKENHVFQSRQATARTTFPVPETSHRFANMSFAGMRDALPPAMTDAPVEADAENPRGLNQTLERISFGDLHQQLLEQYAPPSIVVNEEYDIVHLSERAGRFLQMAGGEPTKNLLKLIRPELRLELRAALYQAVQRQSNVEVKHLKLRIDEREETVNIYARPVLRSSDDTARGFVLVVFEPAQNQNREENSETIYTAQEPVARQLEEELLRTKSQLRGTIEQFEVQAEELKASNEELQALNEELRSAAEELETSKEELQSVNEELVTVNQELKVKIEEVTQSNNDFQNLIFSTDIATIFLDRSFRVNTFTPAASRIFNLIPADYGRPLSDITHRLETDGLVHDAEKVLDTLQAIEREARTNDGRTYLLRVLPYRTSEDRINGVVASFIDITERKLAEEAMRESEEKYRDLFDSMDEGYCIIEMMFDKSGKPYDWRFVEVNPAFEKNNGLVNATGKTILEMAPNIEPKWFDIYGRVAATGKPLRFEEHSAALNRWFSLYAFRAGAPEENRVAVLFNDITKRRFVEDALRESEERLRLLIESAADYAIFTTTTDNRISGWNQGAEKVFGWSESEVLGQSAAIIFTPEDREKGEPEKEIEIALRTGRAPDERFHLRKDGSRFYASGVMAVMQNGDGSVQGFVKIARDMTEPLAAEKALRDKEVLQRLIGAQETERKRIARDLHDELGQQLTALRLKLDAAKKLCKDNDLCDKIDEIELIAKSIDHGVDFLAWELRPAALDYLGLVPALENYVKQWSLHSGVPAELTVSNLKNARFAPEIETNLYRIVQESLNNTHKHAKAKRADVVIEKRDNLLAVLIEDDGKGFNPKGKTSKSKGIGLIGMKERAQIIGGTLEIESAPKRGTTVYVRVPAATVESEPPDGK